MRSVERNFIIFLIIFIIGLLFTIPSTINVYVNFFKPWFISNLDPDNTFYIAEVILLIFAELIVFFCTYIEPILTGYYGYKHNVFGIRQKLEQR